ncbi:tetratricopeptide repeat protein [Kordiimonas sp.]|uniref:tetratricopeptide repeat protein n=1 Tax=Kordiimonas sp. TaxID=1970157 RepID=UPI003A92420A
MTFSAIDEFEDNSLYSEIDYGNIKYCNIYYKRILNAGGIPLPAFCKEIAKERRAELESKRKIKPRDDCELNFLRLMQVVRLPKKTDQAKIGQMARVLLRQYPDDVSVRVTLAKIYIEREQYSAAAQMLQVVCNLDPKDARSLALLGLLASLGGDHGRALSCAHKALNMGEHLNHTMPKAFLFGNLLIGRGAMVSPFDSRAVFSAFPETFDVALEQGANPLAQAVEFIAEPDLSNEHPIVFFSCDSGYLEKFGQNLLLSMVECRDKLSFHVHVVNGTRNNFEWLTTFADRYAVSLIISHETIERGGLAKNPSYLASNRFILAPFFLNRFKRNYLILDADSILNSSLKLFNFFRKVTKPALYYIEHGPVWDKISAPFVYLPFENKGTEKFSLACRHYLLSIFGDPNKKGFWYVDQVALFGSYLKFVDDISLIKGTVLSDTECSDEAIFWTLSNDKAPARYLEKCAGLKQQETA